jgi:hypothetical protein
MASKAMKARLAANLNTVLGDDGDGDGAAVKGGTEDVSGLGGADESSSSDHITETSLSDDGTAAAPPRAARAAPVEREAPDQAAEVREANAALLREKLARATEKRQAERIKERAREERKAAAADRAAAAAEKAKYDGLRTGSFKDTLAALGRDPRKTWEEMNQEAIEASTPEAAARREKEAAERREQEREAALEERFKPVLSELEQLRAERAQWAAQAHQSKVHNAFQHAAADPAFTDLRIEYDDGALLEYATYYDKNPDEFRAHAHQYGVRLTAPEKGFTMHELLQMLSAAQAAHNNGVQARRAAHRPPERQSGSPTVNGTAPRRNAAVTGNDSANGRATGTEDSALSPRERMRQRAREEIRR